MLHFSVPINALTPLLLITMILSSCGDDNDDDNNNFEPIAEFEIEFPSDWEVRDNVPAPLIVVGISPSDGDMDVFRESINIGKEEAPDLDLDQYATAGKESLLIFEDLELISEQRIEINSRAAEELIYTANFDGLLIKNVVHIYYANNTGYVVTATATQESFDSFAEIFNEVLATFVIN